MKLALLGTGLMGAPMARRLHAAGHPVVVWNRSLDKARALQDAGLSVANNPAEAVRGAEGVITMLEHGPAVRAVLFEHPHAAAPAMSAGSLFIDMGSIRPDEAREHAARLAEQGVEALDAPVSGGTVGAEAGTLAIMVGGGAQAYGRAQGVFAPLGGATHVGPPGAGQFAKLANQMIVGIGVAAVAEALLLAQAGGADPARVREALRGGFAESRILEVHGQRMVERDFGKRAAIDVQLKDMRNALHAAQALGLQIPATTALEALFAQASAHGRGDLDQAGILLELEAMNAKGQTPAL